MLFRSLSSLVLLISLAKKGQFLVNFCTEKTTCGACISSSPRCFWCSKQEFDDDIRCGTEGEMIVRNCPAAFRVRPQNTLQVTMNKELLEKTDNIHASEEIVQIKPQRMKVQLVPGSPQTFPLTFKMAENFPLDIYFLVDLTGSMKKYKNNLAGIAGKLSQSLSNITKNHQLGFGAYMDKVTATTVLNKYHDSAYDFKNHVKLTKNTEYFKEIVNKTQIVRGEDLSEGGLDALMQVLVCKREIGWRDVSRRLIIFSSDAFLHYAGDAKLFGIIRPNDEKCHLDASGTYSESLLQDYPSIGQVAAKIREKKVSVIFTVPVEALDMYQRLEKYFEGSIAATMNTDASNIIELLQEIYNNMTSRMQLKAHKMKNIDVKFQSTCGGNSLQDTDTCTGIKRGQKIFFNVTLNLTSCPKPGEPNNGSASIYAVGLPDLLVIDLDFICECECERTSAKEADSYRCSDENGTYVCGRCECHRDRYGKACECTGNPKQDENCIREGTTTVCSDRGQCVCGVCKCSTRDANMTYSGKYCETDNFSCMKSSGELCGGPIRGTCRAGVCYCNEGHTGQACECPLSQENCATNKGNICNGKGNCVCGRCQCTDRKFRGPTCEYCPTCIGKCIEVKSCAECAGFQSGDYSKDQCEQLCGHVEVVKEFSISPSEDCMFRDKDNCLMYFGYEYGINNTVIVQVLRNKDCPLKVHLLLVILPIFGGILGVAVVLLIIWRVHVWVMDSIEYSKFKSDIESFIKTMHGINPLYETNETTYYNPQYRKD